MTSESAVRWSIKVSKETDLSLRTFLGSQGMKKGDLSRFIEKAVLAEVFHQTIADIHKRNRDADPAMIEAEIEAALQETRRGARDRMQR